MKTTAIATALALLWFCQMEGAAFQSTIFDQFYKEDQTLDIVLFTDMARLVTNKNTNDFQAANISYTDASGAQQEWAIRIRPRGKYRRRVCDIPPIKIKFPKEKLLEQGYARHNDLKLVTHCLDEEGDDELVLREYLVYRMFQFLTPLSYRVQLVRITYIDGQTGSRTQRMGILMEDSDEMAERHQRQICEACYGLPVSRFDEENSSMVHLFQYMIGNGDWSLRMKHNVKMLRSESRGAATVFVVPYDFDFATMVDAPYAKMKEVTFPPSSPGTTAAAGQFQKKKNELLGLVSSFEALHPRTRKKVLRQIDAFYNELEKKGYRDPMP